MKRRWILAAFTIVAWLAARRPVFAILGLGDIVFDPSVYAQEIQQVLQLQQQYAQLVQTYQMVENQYEELKWMAQQLPVNMAVRYRAIVTPWQASSATNTYGTTGAWASGINTGLDTNAGYVGAVQPLDSYGAAFGNIPSDQQARIKADYATVELTDGANLSGMQTIGRLRANAPLVEGAIQNLEADAFSSDPSMNTEVGVLNKINAANMLQVHGVQDTNKLLTALAEEQLIDAKRKRDAEARAINADIRFRAEGKTVLDAQIADASSAMQAWRMP